MTFQHAPFRGFQRKEELEGKPGKACLFLATLWKESFEGRNLCVFGAFGLKSRKLIRKTSKFIFVKYQKNFAVVPLGNLDDE